jgi:RNA polymerase sigma-70 factor (ECF subfamily)
MALSAEMPKKDEPPQAAAPAAPGATTASDEANASDDAPASEEATAAEAATIARARQGDENAWLHLVREHQEALFRLSYLILGNTFSAGDAQDVTQEAFVRAYLHLDQFDEGRPLRPWLLGIAANLARNRRRSAGRYWAAVKRWWQNQDAAVQPPAHERRSEQRELWQAVQQLSRRAQEVIYLFYFMELSEAETAQALSVPPGTVKSRLHRARKQLRAVIARDFPDLYHEWQEPHEAG